MNFGVKSSIEEKVILAMMNKPAKSRCAGKPRAAEHSPPFGRIFEYSTSNVRLRFIKPESESLNIRQTRIQVPEVEYSICRSLVIVGDTDFLTHEEFDYRQFETYNIRKTNDAAEKGKFSFDYVSGTATIMAKGVRICDNITITVEDNHGWKKVEKGIERYMLTNKKDIIVKLAVVYAKTGESDSNSSDDEKPSTKKVFAFVCC